METKAKMWLPLYIGDYLADTGHLTAAEHGAYLLILMHQWRAGHIEESALRSVARMDPDAWSISQACLMHLLSKDDEGRWFSKRLDAEKYNWNDKKLKAKEKAKKAADARWSAKRQRDREEKEKEMLGALPEHSSSSAPGHAYDMPFTITSSTPSPLRSEGGGGAVAPYPPKSGRGGVRKASDIGKGASKRVSPSAVARNNTALASTEPLIMTKAHRDRMGWAKEEIKVFIASVSKLVPDGADPLLYIDKLAWGERDDLALNDMLQAWMIGSRDDLKRCLEHRADAIALGYLSASLQPSKWLRDLPSWFDGPLNNFGEPIAKVGGRYKRKGE